MIVFFSSLSGEDKTESHSFVRVLKRLGHDVILFPTPTYRDDPVRGLWVEPGYAYEARLDSLIRRAGVTPDLFLYIENRGLIPRGMESASIPTACILCDMHLWLLPRQHLAKFFDHVFLFQRNYLSGFTEHPAGRVQWLPYACDLEIFRPLERERTIDVAFIGQLIKNTPRAAILTELASRWRVNEQRYYWMNEIPEVYSQAKIVLNMPLGDDLNFRTFEAMSCGAMLLTKRDNNGQEVLFKEGVHYAAYGSTEELYEKVEYYLQNPDERELIAAAGLAEIQRNHSLEQRVERLLADVVEAPEPAAPLRRMSQRDIDAEYAWIYEYWRVAEPGLHLIREARSTGRPWLHLVPPALRSVFRVALR